MPGGSDALAHCTSQQGEQLQSAARWVVEPIFPSPHPTQLRVDLLHLHS